MATPIGVVPKHKIDFRLMRNAGFTWKPEIKDFTIISEEIDSWASSREDNPRANEKKWRRDIQWLPVRYYNFLYALSVCGDDLDKAMDYSEKNLFDLEGKPVYLPDRLAMVEGKDNNSEKHFTYSKILRDVGIEF